MECIVREMIQNKLHPDDMNREEAFSLARSWKLLI
jgi:hypothetical protein